MTQVDKSKSPYYDDYSADKNYHEILFRPRRAVQTRELNQIQSQFKEQLSRFGDNIFEDGSVVIPGESNYDLEFKYVQVNITNYSQIVGLLGSQNLELEMANGIRAKVKMFAEPEGADPATFYIEYMEGSNDGGSNNFQAGDTITINLAGNQIGQASVIGTGLGSKFTLSAGVYYINGRFVLVTTESVLLDKYSNAPSKVVGIQYDEVVVTESGDSSLFDNAQGTPNFSAPGAHRLRVDTKLVVYDLDSSETIPDNVVEIFRISNGQIQKKYRGPDYNILGDVMAQRTYEESGDYTVKSFNIGFADFEEGFGLEDDSKFTIQLDPGLAYVRGYRIETNSKTNIAADKARDVGLINNSSISAALGYYVEVENLSAMPSVVNLQSLNFKDGTSTLLGTARIRFISNPSTNVYRLYLFDVRDTAGIRSTTFINSAVTVDSTDTVTFSADLIESTIYEATFNSLLFPMNVEFVRSLNVNNGQSDTSYSSVKQVTSTVDSSGQVTFTAGGNEVFVGQDARFAFGAFTDTNEFVDISTSYTLGGSPTGSFITLNLGSANAGRPVRLNLQVAKQEVIQKTKTVTQHTISGSVTNGRLALGKADAFRIISITDNGNNDVTNLFTLEPNKTSSFYGTSYIETGSSVSNPVTVVFEYFSHSSGDYFGPDSYVDLDYDDIPNEGGIRLSDVLDFRPRINDAGTGFTGAGSSVGNIPTPFSIIRTDLEHYLKRIDKVYVNSEGEFGVVKGVPDLDPSAPADPAESMVLYTLYVPPYTFDLEGVQAEKVNNRRYTMKDIGNIENRLSNVEYYVTLNMLEQETESAQVTDPVTGANRFKNGFFTDRFIDHGSADFAWPGYHVAMDDEDSELRPEFSMNAIDLQMNELGSSNVVVSDNIVTLPYEEVTYVKQNQRSRTLNVNPYAIYRWTGTLKLNPSMDSWIDTHYTNPDVTYRVFNNGRLTQSWKSWQLNWTGGVNSTSRSFTRTSAPHSVWKSAGAWGEQGDRWNAASASGWRRTTDTFRTTTTTRTNIDVVNDRVVDTSVIPFMRSINVRLTGKGNRPLCRMHFFFDETNINQYIRPVSGSFGNPVVTDIDGNFEAIFRIPNNEQQRFRTGEKQIVATDEAGNNQQVSTSYSQAQFTSTGTRQVRQRTIVATRSTTTNTNLVRRVWSDPLAQSFLVERRGGMFVTKINCFFKTKDPSVPVAVQIREMDNGQPTQTIVPGGEKLLNPSEVNLSDDGSVATTFVFDHPVYLQDGTEYCFVLMSNSNQYNAFIATMGEQDLGNGRIIVKQPYAGVLFKSQNNSTWTEDQQSDLQFEIFAAKFNTDVVGILEMENTDFDPIRLPANPFKTEESSQEVIVNREHHNYVVGSQITILGAVGNNGITTLNGNHIVTEVLNPNQFKITMTETATLTGDIGGENVEISDTVQASILNPNIPVINLPSTTIAFGAKGTTGKSIDGAETPYVAQASYIPVDNETINNLSVPWIITNRADEDYNAGGERTFKMHAIMSTTNENVSPVIDLSGANVITPFVEVTKKSTVEADGSNNWANYRTRVNPLATPADMIKCYLDIRTIDPANVIISVRTANSQEEFETSTWQVIPNITTDTPADGNNFYEYEFEKTGMSQFSFYQIMIQLKSDSSVVFPRCKRLRVMALSDFS
jgi:hypothetical protein